LALALIAVCLAQLVVLAVACLIKQWVLRLIRAARRILPVHAAALGRDLSAMRRLGSEIHAESMALLTQSLRRALPRRATIASWSRRIGAVAHTVSADRKAA
jgi:hypothetical protein